jgi:hypothetical protein
MERLAITGAERASFDSRAGVGDESRYTPSSSVQLAIPDEAWSLQFTKLP